MASGSDSLTVDTFQNLEKLLAPVCYGDEYRLPAPSPGTPSVALGLTFKGRISEDCQWGYTYNGQVIRCFPITLNISNSGPNLILGRSGRVSSVINSVAYHFPGSIIKCDAELKIKPQTGIRKLLLGLDCGTSGALVIFDPIKALPMKWITLPAPVTCVTVLSHFESERCSRPFLSEAMMAMVGVAAVGLVGGQVLVVDLGLDDIDTGGFAYLDQHADQFFNLCCVLPHEDYIVPKRRNAISKKLMICLELNYEQVEAGDEDQFYYSNQFGERLGMIDRNEVHITCLEYVPAIDSIIVGYNFGCFQIWKLDNLELEYSSPFNSEGLPVFSFAFQQPIDDPKNYCYLWVLFGISSAELTPARVELFALVYAEKHETDVGSVDIIYSDFRHCLRKLAFHLQDCYLPIDEDADESMTEGTPMRFLSRPLRMWTHSECILFISWESSRERVSYLGIFDLNQWYSAQTPESFVLSGETHLNPFWCAVSILNPGFYSEIWDMRVVPRTFEKWTNPHVRDEVHLFPASSTFQAACLSTSGVFTFERFGIQEKLFRLIQKEGPTMMTEPALLSLLCQSVGLTRFYNPQYEDPFTQAELDQMSVLTVLVESRRPSLIVHFASKWLDGSLENLGCGVKLILRWMNSFATTIRVAADPHWELMLSHRTGELSPETLHFIHYSNFIWTQLNSLMWTILRPLGYSEKVEHSDLSFALEKLVQYSAAVLMLHRARILPVSPVYMFMDTLKIYYENRRRLVREAFNTCPYLQPEERLAHPLLIDYLFEHLDEEFLRVEWNTERGEPFYPPKEPGLMINLFLGSWMHVPPKLVNRIIFYFLLDLMQNPVNRMELRGDLSSIITLSEEEQSHVTVLWMIDHGEFREALARLALIHIDDEADGLPLSAAMVILAAQGFEDQVFKILRGISFPKKIAPFAFQLACVMEPNSTNTAANIISAFSADEVVVDSLLRIATSKGILDKLLNNSTFNFCSGAIEEVVIKFLVGLPLTIDNCVRLLNFYIKKGRFEQAVAHYKTMLRRFSDRRALTPDQLRFWKTAEVDLRNLMQTTQSQQGERQRSAFAKVPRGNPIYIKAQERIKTPETESKFVTSNLQVMPPQIRLLMKDGMETRAGQTPFSPLRRFSGRVHKFTPHSERGSSGDTEATDIAPFLSPEPADARVMQDLVVDFGTLLKSPKVTRGVLLEEDNPSPDLFATPSSGTGTGGSAESVCKSSMKKHDQSLRKHVLKTRFLNISGSTDEDEEVETPEAEDPQTEQPNDVEVGDTSANEVPPSDQNQSVNLDLDMTSSFEIEEDEVPEMPVPEQAEAGPVADEEQAEVNPVAHEEPAEIVPVADEEPAEVETPLVTRSTPNLFQQRDEEESMHMEMEEPMDCGVNESVLEIPNAADAVPAKRARKSSSRSSSQEGRCEAASEPKFSTPFGVFDQPPVEGAGAESTGADEVPQSDQNQPGDLDLTSSFEIEEIEAPKIPAEQAEADEDAPEVLPVADEEAAEGIKVASEEPAEVIPVADEEPAEVTPVEDEEPPEVTPVADEEPPEATPVADEEPPEATPVAHEKPAEIVPVTDEEPAQVITRSSRRRSTRSMSRHNDDEVSGHMAESIDCSVNESLLETSVNDTVLNKRVRKSPSRTPQKGRSRAISEPRSSTSFSISDHPLLTGAKSTTKPATRSGAEDEEPVVVKTRRSRRSISMSGQRDDESGRMSESLDGSVNESVLETSVTDTVLTKRGRKSSGGTSQKGRSRAASEPKSSTQFSIHDYSNLSSTRPVRRSESKQLNASMLQTPPPRPRRSTRSMSRQLDDEDPSQMDESMNFSVTESVAESSSTETTPTKRALRAKKSPSRTPQKGRSRATSEPRSSTPFSIFDHPLLAGTGSSTKPLTRSVTRLLEQSASDANSSSDGSFLEVSVEEPRKRTASRKRERAQSEPKGASSKSSKRAKSNPKPVEVDSDDEERDTPSDLPKRILRNFRQYAPNLSTVLEDSESSNR